MYRGRIAPSPTGLMHIGHACTFWAAYQRTVAHQGTLVFRNEDLDPQRSKAEFANAMLEDLRWLRITWQEGPDVGGVFAPYEQSARRSFYLDAWRKLRDGGFIYPCTCSRKELALIASAPNEGDDEPMYPGRCRPKDPTPATEAGMGHPAQTPAPAKETGVGHPVYLEHSAAGRDYDSPAGVNWRFRVPDGEATTFTDLKQGAQSYIAGRDFGDFVVWRRDDVPAYQLAVVVDDEAMEITEVVRGTDLLKSTARQLLLIRALGYRVPHYYHCDLVRDEQGIRLAKRHDALSLRALRERGLSPAEVLAMCPQ